MPNYQASGWFVLLAPKGTPKAIITKLNQEISTALSDSALRERITEQGAVPVIMSPEELAKFISAETGKWRDIITKAGIPQIQ
jgi:tripartite-type tricarboxylate transporter receptor subunit TctC